MGKAGEQLVEPPALPVWIAEHEDERVLVGHGRIDHVVDAVGNARSLIDQRRLPSPAIVQTAECVGLVLGPLERVDAPGVLVVDLVEAGRGPLEPVLVDRPLPPQRQLAPQLRVELIAGVGRCGAGEMRARRIEPQDQPRLERGLARTLAGLGRDLDDLAGLAFADRLAELGQELALPFRRDRPSLRDRLCPSESSTTKKSASSSSVAPSRHSLNAWSAILLAVEAFAPRTGNRD
jgi:hypothetical protein